MLSLAIIPIYFCRVLFLFYLNSRIFRLKKLRSFFGKKWVLKKTKKGAFFFSLSILLLTLASINGHAAEPKELVLWHSLAANLGKELDFICKSFNQSQTEYRVTPIYKGEYTESLTSFAAAFRAKNPPALIQVFEVGTASMLKPSGIIKPLDEILNEEASSLPLEHFLPALTKFYSQDNKLQAFPFNVSVPLIYYNATVLEKLGVSKTTFPKTWQELELLASKLKEQGYACVYTSAYPAWIQIESFLALHGYSILELNKRRLSPSQKALLSHLNRLKNWQDLHYFVYAGRTNDATLLFTSRTCPLFSQSSGAYESLKSMVSFKVGVAPLPMDASLERARHNNVIGGGALWAIEGHEPQVYQGIARFLQFLSKPSIQAHWYEQTGYIPLIKDLKGVKNSSLLELAYAEWGNETHFKRADLNKLNQIPLNRLRAIYDEALEAVFAGLKSPKEALAAAGKRANFSVLRFERNNSAS